jgi:nitroreductase
MIPITTANLLENLNWRYATKKFDPSKTIAPEVWAALEDALVLSPSSYGLQPWKFLIVTSPEIKEQLKSLSWNQSQVTDCSHYVVFTIKKNLTAADVDRFVECTATIRDISVESMKRYRDLIVGDVVYGARSLNINEWATRQAYIALGNFMTSAALVGVDTCPMEGLDPVKYDRFLELPQKGFATVVACAAGYRAEDDKHATFAKVRFPNAEMVEYI